MRRFAVLPFLLLAALPVCAAERFVSPTGSGTACTLSAPCSVSTAFAAHAPGDTITVMDGLYQGASVFRPLNSGTATNRSTLRALNKGKVRFDGQGSQSPCDLTDKNYWDIIGINCSGGGPDAVVRVVGSSNNRFYEVVAWDVPNLAANSAVWDLHVSNAGNHSCNNLFEDIAGFGRARKIFLNLSNNCTGSPNRVRRLWGLWENNTNTAPKITFDGTYDSRGLIVENSILLWDQQVSPSQAYGMGAHSGSVDSASRQVSNYWYGNLIYALSGRPFTPGQLLFESGMDDYHFKDLLLIVPPDQPTKMGASLGACKVWASGALTSTNCPTTNKTLVNVSIVGGAPSQIHSHYVQTNVRTGATLSSIYGTESPYLNSGNKGATLCNRYIDGVLTSTPLWPWPMNQRILDARVTAGLSAVDPTAAVEALLGPIPSACKSGGVPPAPVNLRLAP